MTAPVRLTDRAVTVVEAWLEEHLTWQTFQSEPSESFAVGIIAALAEAGLLPEATTVTEWGVRTGGIFYPYPTGGEARARYIASLSADRVVVRRTNHIGPWEEEPSPQTSTDRKAQR